MIVPLLTPTLISTAFELVQGASIFTRLNLSNTYHLVHIKQRDEWKRHSTHLQGIMSIKLCSLHSLMFQALINDVLQDMLNQFIFVYLDDILIFSGSWFRHHLDNHLYIKPEKCEFHLSEVQILGFIITPSNIQMEPRKVHTNWPTPTKLKEVQ